MHFPDEKHLERLAEEVRPRSARRGPCRCFPKARTAIFPKLAFRRRAIGASPGFGAYSLARATRTPVGAPDASDDARIASIKE